MSSGERPIGAAKGKQPNTEALCQTSHPRAQCSRPIQGLPQGALQTRRMYCGAPKGPDVRLRTARALRSLSRHGPQAKRPDGAADGAVCGRCMRWRPCVGAEGPGDLPNNPQHHGHVCGRPGTYGLCNGNGQPPPPPNRQPNSADLFCRFVGFLNSADLFCRFVGFFL